MLTKEDLNEIGVLLDEKLIKNNVVLKDGIVTEVGEMIEQNLFPKFDDMDKRFDKVEVRLEKIERRLTTAESAMVTKDYLDDKLSDLKDVFVMKRKPRPGILLPQN